MSDQTWRDRYLDRFDSLCVDVRDSGRVGLDPPNDPEVRWRVEIPDFAGHRDEPAEELLAALAGEDGRTPPHILEDRRSYTSWGASGATHQVVLHLAKLVGDTALLEALRGLARRVKPRPDDAVFRPQPVELPEAKERALWHVIAMYELTGEAADALTVTGESWSREGGSWTIQLRSPESRFSVELESNGYATLLRVERSNLT